VDSRLIRIGRMKTKKSFVSFGLFAAFVIKALQTFRRTWQFLKVTNNQLRITIKE
jgi:hypothetical protein